MRQAVGCFGSFDFMKLHVDYYARYDDERLLGLISQQQEGALAQLYDRYNRLVFSLAFAIVNDRATAEEITLDVFMRVWQKAGMYRSDQAKVSTWLTHIARNHAIDVLRRRAASWITASTGTIHFHPNPENDPQVCNAAARTDPHRTCATATGAKAGPGIGLLQRLHSTTDRRGA
jgi:DNA-directed RNA polymerase specialized sigma24 family protein